MSKKYISQINSNNFVYPNNKLAEYDVEIIHELKENSVSGTASGFTATISGTTLNVSFSYEWLLNSAEPFINNNNNLNVLSLHIQTPDKSYYKPWICGGFVSDSNVNLTSKTGTASFNISAANLGQTTLSYGTYYFEIRFLGKRAIYPSMATFTIPAPITPTPTPTATLTPTPTPPPGPYPFYVYMSDTSASVACNGGDTPAGAYHQFVITGNTADLCTSTSFTVAQIPAYDFYQFWVSTGEVSRSLTRVGGPTSTTATPDGACVSCSVTPTPTPTSTPTPTPAIFTYVAACTGGTILGWIDGEYAADLQVTISSTCYVTTYTTTSPSIGSLISGFKTFGECCPTPTPTPVPPPVAYGVYTGTTYGTAGGACDDVNYPNLTVYIANGDTISNGDTLYTNTGLTVNYVGNDQYYHIYKDSDRWAAQIGSGGVVSNLTVCSTITPTPTPTATPTATPTPTPPPTYTYVAGCSGGTILGYILGDYAANVQFTATDTNCYVTTYTTTSPSIGSLLTLSSTGTCCPTPTPTPVPPPVGVGIYSGATFGSSTAACSDTNYPNGTVYIANGDTLSNGDTVYTNTGLTVNFVGNDNYYRIYTSSAFYAATISSSGYVNNLTACSSIPTPTPTPTPTSTPTPPSLIEFTITKGTAGSSGSGTACANYPGTNAYTVYNDVGYLSEGSTVYSDALGTTPFPGGAGAGFYYADGSEYGRVNNSGIYTNAGFCTL
ncbi:hypothetical protein UFOVP185_40 [uncultured Caudovirales phage]|uniref:Uncharacterized protein n=1 Tax=uncultured Caudovirales phage TaxID=2100421 RepID=A0A6J7WGP7_9CAUD|nr:hypothetical protein UFOVP185_40 [uncultured Caudovirales phage]